MCSALRWSGRAPMPEAKFSMGTVLALAARRGHAGLTEFDRDYLAQKPWSCATR